MGIVSQAPIHMGDGYSWGGDIIVTLDGVAINLGSSTRYVREKELLALAHRLAASDVMLETLEWIASQSQDEEIVARCKSAIARARNDGREG